MRMRNEWCWSPTYWARLDKCTTKEHLLETDALRSLVSRMTYDSLNKILSFQQELKLLLLHSTYY